MNNPSIHENEAGHQALRAAARATGLDTTRDHFLFLRHGRTAGNVSRIFQHPDIPLCTEGFGDADLAADVLRSATFDHICASDMARAWLTAGRIAAATAKPVLAKQALRERYFGDFIGTSSVGLDWRIDPPNGETLAGFVLRTLQGIAALLTAPPLPLLVSHGGVLRVLCGALDVELPLALTANALPLAFERRAGTWHVTALMPLSADLSTAGVA